MNEFAYPNSIDILIEKIYNMKIYIIYDQPTRGWEEML